MNGNRFAGTGTLNSNIKIVPPWNKALFMLPFIVVLLVTYFGRRVAWSEAEMVMHHLFNGTFSSHPWFRMEYPTNSTLPVWIIYSVTAPIEFIFGAQVRTNQFYKTATSSSATAWPLFLVDHNICCKLLDGSIDNLLHIPTWGWDQL